MKSKRKRTARLTCAELAGDLIGSFRGGPRDASTNKRYLDEAILADYFKGFNRNRRAVKLSIGIDGSLMRRARRLTGLRTRREVLQRALETLVRLNEQERRYRGKLPSGKRRPARIRKLR